MKTTLLTCIMLIAALLTSAAHAQVFIQKQKDQAGIGIGPTEGTKEEKPKSIKELSNDYFKNCTAQKHHILKNEELKLFCGCTAANMSEIMSPEEVQLMSTDTPEGQFQRNRMMLLVYTPCIEFPTRALIMNSCTQQAMLKRPIKTCECIADGMAEFVKERAPSVVENAVKRNIKDLDPLRSLLESRGYKSQERYYLTTCLSQHEGQN